MEAGGNIIQLEVRLDTHGTGETSGFAGDLEDADASRAKWVTCSQRHLSIIVPERVG
jgi:hypothetical protein